MGTRLAVLVDRLCAPLCSPSAAVALPPQRRGGREQEQERQPAQQRAPARAPPPLAEPGGGSSLCLAALSDGLALCVLQFSSARELARLECCGRAFAAADRAHEPSLAEQAAHGSCKRGASERAWPLERGPGEAWKQALDLVDHGFFDGGVRHGFPVAALERTGWQLAYQNQYSHRTSDADLARVPAEARFVFVAARNGEDNPEFAIAACGPRSVVLRATHGGDFQGNATKSQNLDHGVYWYLWPGHAFGFSSHEDLFLWLADCAIKLRPPERNSDDRLSWNLEGYSTGGWRAGSVTELGARPGRWLKCLYYRL